MAVRYIQWAELLDHARSQIPEGAGAPRTMDLRRATSAAYYALFHCIVQQATQHLLGDGWSEQHARVARWFKHKDLGRLCVAATGSGERALHQALTPISPALAEVAGAFNTLYDARLKADYDDLFDISKAATRQYVSVASAATQAAWQLYRVQEASYRRFLNLALGGVNVARSPS